MLLRRRSRSRWRLPVCESDRSVPPNDGEHDGLQFVGQHPGPESPTKKSSPSVGGENHGDPVGAADRVFGGDGLLGGLADPNGVVHSVADNAGENADGSVEKKRPRNQAFDECGAVECVVGVEPGIVCHDGADLLVQNVSCCVGLAACRGLSLSN